MISTSLGTNGKTNFGNYGRKGAATKNQNIVPCPGWTRELYNLWEETTSLKKRMLHQILNTSINEQETKLSHWSAKKDYTCICNLKPCKSKQFWKSIMIMNKCNSSIPVLSQGSTPLSSDHEKAEALNSFLSQCFNHSVPPFTPPGCNHMNTCPEDLLCTVEEVTGMLKSLDISKSSGPNGPFLFLIYINDLTDLDISERSKTVLYVDDILLYQPVSSNGDWKVMHISQKRSPVGEGCLNL